MPRAYRHTVRISVRGRLLHEGFPPAERDTLHISLDADMIPCNCIFPLMTADSQTASKGRRVHFPAASEDGWGVQRQGNLLLVTFSNVLGTQGGADSADKALSLMGDDRVHLLADLFGLDKYESGARQAWQNRLLPQRHRIQSVLVGASSAMARMGATAFGTFLGIPVRVHASAEPFQRDAARIASDA